MIKINLPDDYFDDGKVQKIFGKLAKNIKDSFENMGYSFELKYKNEYIENDETEIPKNIEELLLSPYFYKFEMNSNIFNPKYIDTDVFDILRAFNDLPHQSKFNSLNDEENKSKYIKEFRQSYFNNASEFFDKINDFISNKTKDLKLSKENKENFIKEKYGEHYWVVLNFYNAFTYEHLSGDDRHTIISKMNVSVCPYCNMNYTINYDTKTTKTTADLDHFYPKSKHPLYALCLYNFIPSCPVCNSRFKGDNGIKDSNSTDEKTYIPISKDNYFYPYDDSADDVFRFKYNDIIETVTNSPKSEKPISIEYLSSNEDLTKRVKNSLDMFKAEKTYQNFHNLAKQLLEKSIIYNDTYRNELSNLLSLQSNDKKIDDIVANLDADKDMLKEYIATLRKKDNYTIKKLVFGEKLTEEQMLNESLGKFKNDLLKQFGIFE